MTLTKKLLLTLLFSLFFAHEAHAQATIVITDTSKAAFLVSPDHSTSFGGTPVLTNYLIEIYLKSNPTGTGTPLFAPVVGKPTPVAGEIVTAALKTLAPLQPNTEYIYFVRASGPGGTSNRWNGVSDPFGFPGAPAAPTVGKPGIQ